MKRTGWHGESARHSLAAKGVKTGKKGGKIPMMLQDKGVIGKKQKELDKKVVKEVLEVFKDMKQAIIEDVKAAGDEPIQLTYGFVPVYRDWLPGELDERLQWDASDDARFEVDEAFSDLAQELSDEGIVIWGDEGDGTVMWAGSEKAAEKADAFI